MKTKKRSWVSKITDVFFNPRYFFSKIVADGKMEDAILRAIIWGFVGGVVVLILNVLRGDEFSFMSFFKAVVAAPVLAVVLLFVFAGLMMLVSEIALGDRDWEISVKGTASLFFVYPMALILNAFAWNCISLGIISIVVDLYLMFLFYNFAVYCMHCKKISVIFIMMVIAVFWAILYMTDYRNIWFLLKNVDATLTCLEAF